MVIISIIQQPDWIKDINNIPYILPAISVLVIIFFLVFIFFKKKPKHIFKEYGENLIFYEKKKEGIKCRFYKKSGVLNGKFISYYMQDSSFGKLVPHFTAEFKDGKINGEATEFSISGGLNRLVENYDDGCLISSKAFFTAGVKRGELANEEKFKKEENIKGYVLEEVEEIFKTHKLNLTSQKRIDNKKENL